ncbi:Bacterial dynamin-like protein [Pandoraea terrae]|uniref:Bacterial dynamin-like protein n=1 Tax=Pandoraea terrae TaxID=1537710 RepID=A0A5E4Z3A9_9BURK|nr:dynamin family protein [Pandoraea terrae]VVE55192.1 Bacterial dynamin-like protein [Pandoraea terrae]
MKTPKQVRDDIRTLALHLGQVRESLLKRSGLTIAQIGKECKRTADAIDELLAAQELPEDYKVAVVGRFKTGKSSFVNELLGARLASEDTNPETAAITMFRHGTQVKATVRFVAQDEWVKLQALYGEDAKHIDAHRVKVWNGFGKPKKTRDGEPEEVFDLPALERQFIKPGGYTIEICLAADGSRQAETEFRRKLKEFTSGAKPHHCLVEAIEITSPAPILDEGVLLIDTPGLDDTERFRVGLTEKTVEDVDAILFLTKSGVAYSQSEKEFLLSLLRKGTVKQLIVVITQVDQTYEQHVRLADDNDEEPESLALRIQRERGRIAAEINATLDGLSHDDSPAMRRYREQLGDVEIAFTSAALHRDWKAKKPVQYAIDESDPGGVERLKAQLLRLLSTESRLALAAQNISTGARTSLLDLQAVLQTKLVAIRDIKDKEVAEQKLRTFRDEFGKTSARFEGAVNQQVTLLADRLRGKRTQHGILVENIALLAEQQLVEFEMNDVGRHWRTRRSGYWGYMHGFQTRVANRIFPKVQQMLGEYTELFSAFAKSFEVYLTSLSQEGDKISDSLELGSTLPFEVTTKLRDSLERSLQGAQELIATEELRVTTMLNDFVSDEVSERISERRATVSSIWGGGTTDSQSAEVLAFYREVKALLAQALMSHLTARGLEFGNFLVMEAEGAPRDALNEVQVLLEQATDNIRAAATALVVGQKEAVQSLVAAIEGDNADVLRRADELMQLGTTSVDDSMKLGVSPESHAVDNDSLRVVAPDTESTRTTAVGSDAMSGGWAASVQRDATVVVKRIRLQDGSVGWPYDKLFEPTYLKGAVRMTLIDPYLAAHHQIRNMNEFLLHVAEAARPKEIEIITGFAPTESVAHQERAIDNTAKDLFQNFGVLLKVRRETGLHDRYLVVDHGVLFKLGRGLDIYKPAMGLATHRPASRRVRESEIDVFALPGHFLTQQTER